MEIFKKRIVYAFLVGSIFLVGCSDSELSTEEQLAEDIKIIEQYITNNNLQNVEKTSSGLHYVIQTAGNGNAAVNGDNITVHYTGTFTNSVRFDSSVDRNLPFSFTLGDPGVIAGWNEGLQLFNVGDKGLLLIPSALAYGSQGFSIIDPNTVLIFEVELLSINLTEEEQLALDTEKIDAYVLENNIQNVAKTPSGLQYVIQTEGTGSNASSGSTVSVHYTGTLLNGIQFDSSLDRTPFNFSVGSGQVIVGFDEGVRLFNSGAKGLIFLPSSLAYGRTGSGSIGPNEVLIFEIELLSID